MSAPLPTLSEIVKTILANRELSAESTDRDKIQFRELVVYLNNELSKPSCVVETELFGLLDNHTRVMIMQMFCGMMIQIANQSIQPNQKP